jgi:hypothetical protein
VPAQEPSYLTFRVSDSRVCKTRASRDLVKGMMGLEPTTFCMATASSQTSLEAAAKLLSGYVRPSREAAATQRWQIGNQPTSGIEPAAGL